MRKGNFDPIALYDLVDDIRTSRGLTWATMSEQAGVSASTMTRMSQGRSPDVHGLVAILAWGGLDANEVLKLKPSVSIDTISGIRLSLRNDDRLSDIHAETIGDTVRTLYARLARPDSSRT